MISYTNEVIAVGGNGHRELGVQAATATTIIIAAQRAALFIVDIDDRVEGRTQCLGEGLELHALPFLQCQLEIIYITGLFDDAVQRDRITSGLRRFGLLIIRLDFQRIVKGHDTERIPRGGRLFRFRQHHVVWIKRGGHLHVFFKRRARLFDEPCLHHRSSLTTRWVDHVRPHEGANVQAIEVVATTAIRRLAHHDSVVAILGGFDTHVAVHAVQDCIV